MDQAADVFKLNEDQALLSSLKAAGLGGQTDKVNELSVKFEEHSEQLQEVIMSSVLLGSIAVCSVRCDLLLCLCQSRRFGQRHYVFGLCVCLCVRTYMSVYIHTCVCVPVWRYSPAGFLLHIQFVISAVCLCIGHIGEPCENG